MSALFALAVGQQLLVDRDEYVKRVKEELPALVSPSPSPGAPSLEEEAGKAWDTRGVALPLAGISVILSMLMFAGCLRALRGSAWGASAWKTAALAWLAVQVVIVFFAAIKRPESLNDSVEAMLLGSIYPLTSLWYLRRPHIAALFR